jgi:hypothetical protein
MTYALSAFALVWGFSLGWTWARRNRPRRGLELIQDELEFGCAFVVGFSILAILIGVWFL